MTNEKLSTKDMFLRGIAILGLIAVLLLGAWGIIQIAVNLPSFVGSVGSSVASLFSSKEEPVATTTPTTPAVTAVKPATAGKPTTTYVAAGNRKNLWGSPDLSVRVLSVNSLSSIQGRTVIQFEVVNNGTNVAGIGWTFNAQLPWANQGSGSYNWSAGPQQALYPGDRIVYTLGFDSPFYRCNAVITVDPYNVVWETNEYNNSISIAL